MRSMARSLVFGISVALLSVASVSAAPLPAPGVKTGSIVEKVQRYGYCEELRRACEYKGQLGERGLGNCRRYKEECLRGPGYCENLRRRCLFKDERGERGQGNCERYREECRGGRY